jgi:hypothetical protein
MHELSAKRVGLGVALRSVYPTMLFALGAAVIVGSCGGDDNAAPGPAPTPDSGRGVENTGQSCMTIADCYPDLVEGGALKGAVQCLDRVTGGYCTHLCQADTDCCAVMGECKSGFKQVCAPFESTGMMMCFLSCEQADLHASPDGGVLDDTGYCQAYASPEFTCRSTGGGKDNRKVCVPGGAPSDAGGGRPDTGGGRPDTGGGSPDTGGGSDAAGPDAASLDATDSNDGNAVTDASGG